MGKHRNVSSPRRAGDGGGPGYKNPPGAKWAPGQSGNPSGKRKSPSKRLLRDALPEAFHNVLHEEIVAPDGDTMPVLVALVRRICGEGLSKQKAALEALRFALAVEATSDHDRDGDRGLSPEDEAIVVKRLGAVARERGEASGQIDEDDIEDEEAGDA